MQCTDEFNKHEFFSSIKNSELSKKRGTGICSKPMKIYPNVCMELFLNFW
jgi:hypothetical protein